jgi:hypothetical protein
VQARGIFTVAKGALLPGDARARAMFDHLKVGDRVVIKVHRARNPEHNELAHAVFDRVAAATGQPVETLKLWLKWKLGYVDLVKMPDGKRIPSPRSLDFESMSQEDFQKFWDEAWVLMSEELLPGIPQEDFDAIRAIVGGKQ